MSPECHRHTRRKRREGREKALQGLPSGLARSCLPRRDCRDGGFLGRSRDVGDASVCRFRDAPVLSDCCDVINGVFADWRLSNVQRPLRATSCRSHEVFFVAGAASLSTKTCDTRTPDSPGAVGRARSDCHWFAGHAGHDKPHPCMQWLPFKDGETNEYSTSSQLRPGNDFSSRSTTSNRQGDVRHMAH